MRAAEAASARIEGELHARFGWIEPMTWLELAERGFPEEREMTQHDRELFDEIVMSSAVPTRGPRRGGLLAAAIRPDHLAELSRRGDVATRARARSNLLALVGDCGVAALDFATKTLRRSSAFLSELVARPAPRSEAQERDRALASQYHRASDLYVLALRSLACAATGKDIRVAPESLPILLSNLRTAALVAYTSVREAFELRAEPKKADDEEELPFERDPEERELLDAGLEDVEALIRRTEPGQGFEQA